MGLFYAPSYKENLAHQTYNRQLHKATAWANMILDSGMAGERNTRIGPYEMGCLTSLPHGRVCTCIRRESPVDVGELFHLPGA